MMLRLSIVVLASVHVVTAAQAGQLNAHVTGEDGKGIADAVIYALPATGGGAAAPGASSALMVQENQEFVPFVLPIQLGAAVEFPNRDSFRHHVYSFSPAKPFELKLFGGNEKQVVTFDKEGVVALGCNIHDNMVAYIYVVNTPYFAKTNADGMAALGNLPAGDYTVKVWHPNQKAGTGDNGTGTAITAEGARDFKATIMLKRDRKGKKSGAMDQSDY